MKASYLRLVAVDEQGMTRSPRAVLVELQSATAEMIGHVGTHGLDHTGEEWLLAELREIEKGIHELLGKKI